MLVLYLINSSITPGVNVSFLECSLEKFDTNTPVLVTGPISLLLIGSEVGLSFIL